MQRKWIKKNDLFVICAVLFVALLILLFFNMKQEGTQAVVTYNGDVVLKIPLVSASNGLISIKETDKVSFEVKDGAIRFVNVDCHDKICEKSGFISKVGATAVCLPNKTTLKVVGNSSSDDIDIIAS